MSGGTDSGLAFLQELKKTSPGHRPGFSAFARFLDKKAREQGVPLSGQFELTPLCNFRCGMCYVQLNADSLPQPVLTADQWKGLFDQAARAGMLRAILTGGECLAYPAFDEVYEHLQALGCEVTVMTNGALLDDERVRYFLKHRPGEICVTLYGDSEDAYERVTGRRMFETVKRNLLGVRDAGLPLEISVTPNEALGEDAFGTLRLARELCPAVRVNTWLTAPREETGRRDHVKDLGEDFYIRLLRLKNELDGVRIAECPEAGLPPPGGPRREGEARGLLCGGGRSTFSVNWRGVMSPCNELEMVKAYPLRDGFDEAWRQVHEAALSWPRAIACEGCAYAPLCAHCAGRLMRCAAPGIQPTALCAQMMRFVRQGVYPVPECETQGGPLNMKQPYETPVAEKIEFGRADVVLTSGGAKNPGNHPNCSYMPNGKDIPPSATRNRC